ncbi:hypothetical protein EON64_01280 [archaeon]|nr:MAG: hypothetical protein EON64_01280 [archaeon]
MIRLSLPYYEGHPSFCGLGSLTMSLNALLLDPKRVWQGVWRWFDDSMLDCCSPLDKVRLEGITLPKVACLARCNGANVKLVYGDSVSVEDFRTDVSRVCSLPADSHRQVMVVSYSRKTLHQSGSGHFSPIGGYHAEKDMVLIMDVARFKYPPHWVPLQSLYDALQPIDPATNKCRGYIMLSVSEETRRDCCCGGAQDVAEASGDIVKPAASSNMEEGEEKIKALLDHTCAFCSEETV